MRPYRCLGLAVHLALGLLIAGAASGANAAPPPAEAPLDTSLKPDSPESAVPSILKDMGVVQRKAMNKAGKMLLSNYLSIDFSDGPYSMYGINLDVGYAASDFWEIYLKATPFFINRKRAIVDKVEALTLSNGERATITSAKPEREFGVEVLWAPLYGKDSFGIRSIVRSDSFIKLGATMIQYDQGNGAKLHAAVGKTFFLGSQTGLRASVAGNYAQTIVDGVKEFRPILMLEAGMVFYLF